MDVSAEAVESQELINSDPDAAGWLLCVRVETPTELEDLISERSTPSSRPRSEPYEIPKDWRVSRRKRTTSTGIPTRMSDQAAETITAAIQPHGRSLRKPK